MASTHILGGVLISSIFKDVKVQLRLFSAPSIFKFSVGGFLPPFDNLEESIKCRNRSFLPCAHFDSRSHFRRTFPTNPDVSFRRIFNYPVWVTRRCVSAEIGMRKIEVFGLTVTGVFFRIRGFYVWLKWQENRYLYITSILNVPKYRTDRIVEFKMAICVKINYDISTRVKRTHSQRPRLRSEMCWILAACCA